MCIFASVHTPRTSQIHIRKTHKQTLPISAIRFGYTTRGAYYCRTTRQIYSFSIAMAHVLFMLFLLYFSQQSTISHFIRRPYSPFVGLLKNKTRARSLTSCDLPVRLFIGDFPHSVHTLVYITYTNIHRKTALSIVIEPKQAKHTKKMLTASNKKHRFSLCAARDFYQFNKFRLFVAMNFYVMHTLK